MQATAPSRFLRFRAAVVAGLTALSIGGCVSMELKERELVFSPIREPAGWYSGLPDGVQELYLPLGEGAATQRIHAWWWPDDDPNAPVIYYLHGARWNLTGHLNRISQLRRFGYSVFAIDYRGFGKSDGDLPSEASVYEDARAGWQWLIRREPDASRRFIYGHSLGGAIAIDLAAQLSTDGAGARGLIVESTFTSLAEMATELSNGWLPADLFLTQKFTSIEKIRRIRMPVLVVHGAGDRYVPARFSEALYAAAPEPKKLLIVENGSHNNSMRVGDADYRQALRETFGPIGGPQPTATETSPPARSPAVGLPVNRPRVQDVLNGDVQVMQ
jgi:alpha-beta hydrolase superfamily lysophospholipase